MDIREIITTAWPMAVVAAGGLVGLAKWSRARQDSREERDEKRVDAAHALIVETLNKRITSLETQVAQLMSESCLVRGCFERRAKS